MRKRGSQEGLGDLSPLDMKLAPTKYLLNKINERENTYTLKITSNIGINNYREKEQRTCRQIDTEKMNQKSCQTGKVEEIP